MFTPSNELKTEDDRGLREGLYLSHGRYVLHDECVGVLDLARPQLVEAEHLPTAASSSVWSRRGSAMEAEAEGRAVRDVGLRALLLGPPLNARGVDGGVDGGAVDPTVAALGYDLQGVRVLLRRVYGADEEAAHADAEMRAVCALDGATPVGATCQRAALLFALMHEPELAAHYGPYGEDMAQRVLPFVIPRFVANSCQRPDALVQLCVALAELWAGEPLGNWPARAGTGASVEASAHNDVPVGRVAEA